MASPSSRSDVYLHHHHPHHHHLHHGGGGGGDGDSGSSNIIVSPPIPQSYDREQEQEQLVPAASNVLAPPLLVAPATLLSSSSSSSSSLHKYLPRFRLERRVMLVLLVVTLLVMVVVMARIFWVWREAALRGEVVHRRALLRVEAQRSIPLKCTGVADAPLPVETRAPSKPLAIVRPFTKDQVEKMLSYSDRWDSELLYPCTSELPAAERPVLIFYFHRELHSSNEGFSIMERIRQRVQQSAAISQCFNGFEFISAGLKDKEDEYKLVFWKRWLYSAGTCNMFYPVFRDARFVDRFSHFFLMEPDVVPVRRNWLDRLRTETMDVAGEPPVWMKGNLPAYDGSGDIVNGVQWTAAEMDFHLNGNGLYRLGDECFNSVLERVRHEYRDEPFDMSLHSYSRACENRTPEELRILYPSLPGDSEYDDEEERSGVAARRRCNRHGVQQSARFVRSEFLVNYGNTPYSLRDTLDQHPTTVLVHGLRQTDSRDMVQERHEKRVREMRV